ncbi:MAG: hypothetical protein JKY08_07570 [Flavobacteriaceae bacterium]|nr:hypothetical protein [Flavobacteriaceae bacterium]
MTVENQPLALALKNKKRALELEFIFCFLLPLKNAEEMQKNLSVTLFNRISTERMALRDKDQIGITRILFEMAF